MTVFLGLTKVNINAQLGSCATATEFVQGSCVTRRHVAADGVQDTQFTRVAGIVGALPSEGFAAIRPERAVCWRWSLATAQISTPK